MSPILKLLTAQHFACTVKGGSFLGFPAWYHYLQGTNTSGSCSPQLTSLSAIWLIVAAVIEILLRLAAIAAVGIIIYAGVQYSTSSGNPEQTSKSLNTIISAAVGLLICVASAALVTFIAGSFK